MAKTLKPYEVALDPDLAEEILNIPMPPNPDLVPASTIGGRVREAMASVERANKYLKTSTLASLVADTVMRQLKKRGAPSIRVNSDGTVVLHVSYEGVPEPRAKPPVERQTRSSDLPKLDELRVRAEEAGIDISDLGRQRRAIFERVEAAEEALAEEEAEQENVTPPVRLVDEVKDGPAPPDKKPKRNGLGIVPIDSRGGDDLDVDDLLDNITE